MGSHAASPDDEVSQYNDCKGLQFTVEFAPLPNPSKKTWKNAKPKLKRKTIFVHEDSALSHMLYEAIKALHRKDDLSFSWTPRDDKYTSTTIDIQNMTYTIPKTQFKEMALTSNKDYDVLLAEVMKKAKPETVKISPHELGDDDKDSSEDKAAHKKKKQKTYEPTEEEVEQNELIKNLNAEWKCEDTWAGAIQGKVLNEDRQAVDLKNPPDDKIFSHLDTDPEDLALVRNRATQKASAKDSNITINLMLPETVVPPIIPAHPHQPAPLPRPCIACQHRASLQG
ncbi:hypothetical protein B0H13DRAFT_2349499 [Mycena leptocephala]|nr:hypothetical protein B0H13DRAFT_2349499 [Mycena leptocephala]